MTVDSCRELDAYVLLENHSEIVNRWLKKNRNSCQLWFSHSRTGISPQSFDWNFHSFCQSAFFRFYIEWFPINWSNLLSVNLASQKEKQTLYKQEWLLKYCVVQVGTEKRSKHSLILAWNTPQKAFFLRDSDSSRTRGKRANYSGGTPFIFEGTPLMPSEKEFDKNQIFQTIAWPSCTQGRDHWGGEGGYRIFHSLAVQEYFFGPWVIYFFFAPIHWLRMIFILHYIYFIL